ncbi:MAG: hypothetical protein U0441_13425 [Polyangiaceae bacterium]
MHVPSRPASRALSAPPLVAAGLGLLAAALLPACYSEHTLIVGSGDQLTCWGDPAVSNTIEECVIFARADAGKDPGDGTKASPFTSLQAAIEAAAAHTKRVYACGTAPFKESVHVGAPVEVWGGFDCDKWLYTETARAHIDGPPDLPALTIGPDGAGALIVGFAIKAPPSELPGGSSIGVVVDKVDAQTFLWRCDISTSDGNDGVDGDPVTDPAKAGTDAAYAGLSGAPTPACTAAAQVEGGDPGTLGCEDGTTVGGKGGFGGTAPNADGQDGTEGAPMPADNPMLYGKGGAGESENDVCAPGAPGAPGAEGLPGYGAETAGALTLQGISAVNGKPGQRGARGQGGGGGGGARAGQFCMSGGNTVIGPGASGGGGGAGGCGGKGGNGGTAGGSSIGVLSMGGKLVLNLGSITVGRGGKGGNGSAGQPGGPGGKGADGGAASGLPLSEMGCTGGDGGAGGPGGSGGGGRGGHSVGVAYNSGNPITNYVTTILGQPGKGGFGGLGNEDLGKGKDGVSEETHQFAGF